ncbi:protein gar2-like [Pecten maximus]|uniref:protein gar2-like n=1 Tax=Pecten maximus TaxID=6579 RepID=UPI0014585834|nr:protein gar2-like [Pecten maximus]
MARSHSETKMEVFVKRLVKKSDLSVLTKRMIREEYKKHIGRSHLDVEEKVELARLVTNLLENLTKKDKTDVQQEEHDSPNEKENSNPTESRKGKGNNSIEINKSSPKKQITPRKNVSTPNKKKKMEGAEKKSFSLVETLSQNKMLNSSQDSLQKSSDGSCESRGNAGTQSSGSKYRVDEVLDVVMNSEGDDDDMSLPVSEESDEDEEDNTKPSQEDGKKEELKFKKYHLVQEDDEDTWKPFTPVKESKPVQGRIESSSDESVQLSSDGEGGKKISHSKNHNRKKSKKRMISSDEESPSDYSECENSDYENKKKPSKSVSTSASKRRKLNSTEEKTPPKLLKRKCQKI